MQAGDWSSPSTWTPARAPIATDVVRVAHAVSVSGTAPVADCVGVTGTLTLSDNARLTAATILVYESGALEAGNLRADLGRDRLRRQNPQYVRRGKRSTRP